VVARFERLRRHARRTEHRVARIVEVPVRRGDTALGREVRVQRRAGVRREDVECSGLDALLDGPLHRAVEDGLIILVHAEDETRVHHHTKIVQPAHRFGVVLRAVLQLVLRAQVLRTQGFEADEQAAQPARRGLLDQAGMEYRSYRRAGLPQPPHAAHPLEERGREARIAKHVIIQEVEMAARQAFDLFERIRDQLRVERFASAEEGVLVAEVAVVRAAARDHKRVRREIQAPLDQVAARLGQACEAAHRRAIHRPRMPRAKIREEARPGVIAGAEEDRVGMPQRFLGKRGDVQAAEGYVRTLPPVVIRERVRAIRRGDVDLDHHQVRLVVEGEPLDVLVLNGDPVVIRKMSRERGQAERRKQRVLDGVEEGTGGFSESGQDHLDGHAAKCKVLYITKSRPHSNRSATSGSTRLALHAGM
jgi:hypothetical protein